VIPQGGLNERLNGSAWNEKACAQEETVPVVPRLVVMAPALATDECDTRTRLADAVATRLLGSVMARIASIERCVAASMRS
jgi:hypothetical protein